jgi:hypothetical protein
VGNGIKLDQTRDQRRKVMILELTDTGTLRASRADVFHCFWRAELWPQLTSHVTGVEMLEEQDCWQRYALHVQVDGKPYVMETRRMAVPPNYISFQQPKPPSFMRTHTGVWRFEENPWSGTIVTVTHRVDLDDEKAMKSLGLASVEQARQKVTENLHKNGVAMITSVGEFLAAKVGKEVARARMAS